MPFVAAPFTIRTPSGEESLDLEELEARVRRGEVDASTQVRFPPVTGHHFVRAAELPILRPHFQTRAIYFQRAFHLGRVPLLTGAVALACVAVFAAEGGFSGPVELETMVALGAKAGPLVVDLGQWWRLFTANFVHRDLAHLGFNLFVLFHFGAALENAYRPLDHALILLASALGTTLASLAGGDELSAGASGIAYGMLGGAVVFGLRYRKILPEKYRRVLGGAVIPTVLVFLFIGFTSAGIDNYGHLGGLVGGAGTTALFTPRLLAGPPGRAATVKVIVLVGVAALLVAGGPIFGPGLAILRTERDDAWGVQLRVPARWRRAEERFGHVAWSNGLPPPARAAVALTGRVVEDEVGLEAEAARFARLALEEPEAAGRITQVVVAPPRWAHVGGMLGLQLEARYDEQGARTVLVANFFSRGGLVYALVRLRPDALEAYDAVLQSVASSLVPVEPAFLRERRARALLSPFDPVALRALAAAEADAGGHELAREVLRIAERHAPEDGLASAMLASLAFEDGLTREGCAAAGRALARAPGEAAVIEAVADCAWARGDGPTALARLRDAARARPEDGRLARKRARARAALGEDPWDEE